MAVFQARAAGISQVLHAWREGIGRMLTKKQQHRRDMLFACNLESPNPMRWAGSRREPSPLASL